MLRTAITLSVILAAGTAQAAAYKCESPDGSITFSDIPCPDAPSEEVPLHDEGHRAPAGANDPLEAQRRMAEEYDRQREAEIQSNLERRRRAVEEKQARDAERERIRSAKIHDRIVRGMDEDDVRDVLGRPDHINRSSRGDQWVYQDGDEDQYVYVRDGRVTSWQRYGTDDD